MGFTGLPTLYSRTPRKSFKPSHSLGQPDLHSCRPHTATIVPHSQTLVKLCDDLVPFDLANTNPSQLRQCTSHLNASVLTDIPGWTAVQSDRSDVSSDSSTRGRRKLVRRQIFESESNLARLRNSKPKKHSRKLNAIKLKSQETRRIATWRHS